MSIVAATTSLAIGAGVAYWDTIRKRKALENRLGKKVRGSDHSDVDRAVAQEKVKDLRDELQRTLALREAELKDDEEQLAQQQETIDRRVAVLKERDDRLAAQFASIKEKKEEVGLLRDELEHVDKLFISEAEKVAGTRCDRLLEHLSIELTDEARVAAQRAASIWIDQAKNRNEVEAKRIMDVACHRYGMPLPADRLHVVVDEPRKAERKKILQADNFALLEGLTELSEVSFEYLEDGGGYYLQGPDPYTREMGRLAYLELIRARHLNEDAVKVAFERAEKKLTKITTKAGNEAEKILGLKGIDKGILFLVGKLLYRTSYTQNQWQHAIETAHLCGMMAMEMGLDLKTSYRSALMHDIGKVLWAETEAVGSHAVSGAAFASAHGEKPEIVHPIAAHHGDEKPSTPLAHLVAAADALSGARPGARTETAESYTQRVEEIDRICGEFRGRGISRSYVIQGGREVRVLVNPQRVDDHSAARLSADVAARIEDECVYPGQIKVTVIRDTQSSSVARSR